MPQALYTNCLPNRAIATMQLCTPVWKEVCMQAHARTKSMHVMNDYVNGNTISVLTAVSRL